MSEHDDVFDAVRAIVGRVAGPGRTPEAVSRDTLLTDGYWLDSVELLDVVIACETTFGIVFDEERDLEPQSFDTLGRLADRVRSKIARKHP